MTTNIDKTTTNNTTVDNAAVIEKTGNLYKSVQESATSSFKLINDTVEKRVAAERELIMATAKAKAEADLPKLIADAVAVKVSRLGIAMEESNKKVIEQTKEMVKLECKSITYKADREQAEEKLGLAEEKLATVDTMRGKLDKALQQNATLRDTIATKDFEKQLVVDELARDEEQQQADWENRVDTLENEHYISLKAHRNSEAIKDVRIEALEATLKQLQKKTTLTFVDELRIIFGGK